MAGGNLGFWSSVQNAIVAFLLCVFAIVMTALLVSSIINGKPDVSAEGIVQNTAPIGRMYQRPE